MGKDERAAQAFAGRSPETPIFELGFGIFGACWVMGSIGGHLGRGRAGLCHVPWGMAIGELE